MKTHLKHKLQSVRQYAPIHMTLSDILLCMRKTVEAGKKRLQMENCMWSYKNFNWFW